METRSASSLTLLLLVTITCALATQELSYSLQENSGIGFSVGNIHSRIGVGSNFKFANNSDPLCSKYFILVSTGEVQTKIDIDREALIEVADSDSLTCVVNYKHDSKSLSLLVTFDIQDVNDVVPSLFGLDHPVHSLTIFENLEIGQPVLFLMPYDLDKGANGTVNYTIVKGNEDGYFRLSPAFGDSDRSPDRLLYLQKELDHEKVALYNFTIQVTDQGVEKLTSTQQLLIHVEDINDQAPSFPISSYSFEVPEDHLIGKDHPFGRINATDEDSATHAQIFYQLDQSSSQYNDLFAVNTTTGELYLLVSRDYDDASTYPITYDFRVEARNPESPTGTLAQISVTITDVNDESPYLVNINNKEISENVPSGFFLATYSDKDKNIPNNMVSNASLTFIPKLNHSEVAVQKLNNLYFLSFTITEPLDREKTPEIVVTISVTDEGTPPQTSHINVTITVTDENDNAPQFTDDKFIGKISEVSQPERHVLTVSANDPDEGSNGQFYFVIDSTSPVDAQEWFSINSTNGQLLLTAKPTSDLNGKVEITVAAIDTGSIPNTNFTTVEISVIPSITLEPDAFQEYSNFDLISSSVIYIEFRTDRNESNALLLYQYSSTLQQSATLQLIDSKLVYSSTNVLEKAFNLYQNQWYSVLINKNDQINPVKVWEREKAMDPIATELLQTSELNSCTDQTDKDDLPLFIGGVENIFTIQDSAVSAYNFNGEISTVIINNIQLDTSCPFKQRSILSGSHISPLCTPKTDPCNRYSSCVSYTTDNSVCQCKSGLPPWTCDEETDFDAISLTGGTHIEFELGYSYFYQTQSSSNLASSNVTQTINISIIPATESLTGVLFYSKTDDSVQRFEIDQTIRYTVSTNKYELLLSLVTEEVVLLPGVEYNLVLQIMSGNELGRIAYGETGSDLRQLRVFPNTFGSKPVPCMFAKQPNTKISLGGASDSKISLVKGDFSGCITKFAIDNTLIPIRSFIDTTAQNLTVHGLRENVSLSCHSCFKARSCPDNSKCEIQGHLAENEHECICQSGRSSCVEPTEGSPRQTTTTALPTASKVHTGDIENPTSSSKLELGAIAGIAGGIILIVVLIMVSLTVIIRCAYLKGRRKHGIQFITRATYHQGPVDNHDGQNHCNDINNDKDLIPTATRRLNDYVQTPIKHSRCPSSEIDGDSILDDSISPSGYRKSTSQETGFQTASEFEAHSSRQSSPRRAYDSGKSSSEPFDSDIETDSESLNTSGIEDALSPNDMRLVSSGSLMGVPSSFRKKHPLSPKERVMLVPIRPNSELLLVEDETDTEISTTTNTTTNRQMVNDNDSITSDPNGPKWYKSCSPSTTVSNDSSMHYSRQALEMQKHSRRKILPPTFRQHKSNTPVPHYYIHHNGHVPLSSSPLVQKAHRFDYPPYNNNNSPTTSRLPFHYENVDPTLSRLPVIAESAQYSHQPPYHPQHSDHSSYMEMEMSAMQHPHIIHQSTDSIPYYPGYQGTNLTPRGGGTGGIEYRDLNSFAQVNPITYWEQQQRLRPTVDDGLNFLTEPYTKFEDVSTTPSVVESTLIDGEDGRESVITGSEFGGVIRRPLTSRGIHNDYGPIPVLSKMPRSRRNSERDSISSVDREIGTLAVEDEEEDEDDRKHPITHFPSADCTTPTFLEDNSLLDSTTTLAEETIPQLNNLVHNIN